MKQLNFPHEDHLMQMKQGEEIIIHLNGETFIVSRATEDDIERVNKGFFVMD